MIKELVQQLTKKYGTERKALIPILQGIIEKESYLSQEAMTEVARALDISGAEVFGTASFYSFLDTKHRGKYIIRVCQTIVCDMQGKKEVVEALEGALGIKMGETTSDGMFSLLPTNCLGWCAESPAMLINDEVYTKVTPDKAREIIKSYKLKQ